MAIHKEAENTPPDTFPVTVGQISRWSKFTPNSLPNPCPVGTFPYFRVAIRPVKSSTYASSRSLITQRSVVQIHPPQPIKSIACNLIPGSAPEQALSLQFRQIVSDSGRSLCLPGERGNSPSDPMRSTTMQRTIRSLPRVRAERGLSAADESSPCACDHAAPRADVRSVIDR